MLKRLYARLIPHTARIKILMVFIAINLAATVAYTLYAWNLKADAVRETIDARLVAAASAAPKMIGYDYLREARDPQAIDEQRYLAMVRLLHDYCQKVGLRYLYVFTQEGNRIIYLADAASEEEIRAGNYGRYYGEYDTRPMGLAQAFTTGKPQFAEYEDRYGHFRSVFQPMQREDGKTLVFGADIDLSDVEAQQREALNQALLIGMGLFLAGVLGSFWLARTLSAPLSRLAEAADRIADGDYRVRVPARGHDEFALLARAFNSMGSAISEREAEIIRMAYIDPLTELPNRVRLAELIAEEIQAAQQGDDSVAVVMIDIDRFKYINDYLGYSAGDAALKSIAQRLRQVQRDTDHLGRFSGDEFVLILPGVHKGNIDNVVRRLHRILENPLAIAGQSIDVAGSTGVAFFPLHGTSANVLLREAEAAMYLAKRTHADYLIYDPGQEANRKSQLSLLGELKTAVEGNQLSTFLQPKINLNDGRICGVEALVRWNHPERGWIPPGQFIPFAEQTGKIRALTLWMLRECMLTSCHWAALGRNVRISVNVSVNDTEDPAFAGMVQSLLEETGADAHNLCLEITESATMEAPDKVLEALRHLRSLGFKLSIDDFGTGYSSLAYLSRLPVQELKIDRSFILRLDQADGLQIARAIVELGHVLKLDVVAEGVETQAAWDTLVELGCDQVQGFLVAKPMPIVDFDAWYKRHKGYWREAMEEDESGQIA